MSYMNYDDRDDMYVDSYYSRRSQFNGGSGRRSRNGFYNSRSSYNRNPRQIVKHSGAKKGTYKNKQGETAPYINGWNYSRRNGMVKVIAVPTKNPETKSERSEKWVATIQRQGLPKQTVTAFYNLDTHKLTIPDMEWVLNPNAPNGGYCGKYFRTSNRR